MAATHKGECFCGAVHVEVAGEPEAMGYCHCQSCRSWSAAPVNAFTLWKPGAVRVTAGAKDIATFQKTKFSQRQYCRKCGGHLMNNHPTIGLVDVYAATLPTLRFSAGVHINYADTVLPMRDGLPKLKDSQRVWRLRRRRAGVRRPKSLGNDRGNDRLWPNSALVVISALTVSFRV